MPNPLGVLETSLYVEEFERASPFCEQVLGLNSIYRDQRLCAHDVGSRGVFFSSCAAAHSRPYTFLAAPFRFLAVPFRRMTGMGRCTLHFQSRPTSFQSGRSGSRRTTSPSKAAANGARRDIYFRDPDRARILG